MLRPTCREITPDENTYWRGFENGNKFIRIDSAVVSHCGFHPKRIHRWSGDDRIDRRASAVSNWKGLTSRTGRLFVEQRCKRHNRQHVFINDEAIMSVAIQTVGDAGIEVPVLDKLTCAEVNYYCVANIDATREWVTQ